MLFKVEIMLVLCFFQTYKLMKLCCYYAFSKQTIFILHWGGTVWGESHIYEEHILRGVNVILKFFIKRRALRKNLKLPEHNPFITRNTCQNFNRLSSALVLCTSFREINFVTD